MISSHSFSHANTHNRLASSSKKRILILDDQMTVLVFLRDRLEEFGFEVFLASNVLEGMPHFDHSFHGILLSLEMPGIHRKALLRQLRKRYSPIPVIAMSTDMSRTAIIEAIEAGAQDYLIKPISLDALQYKCTRLFA